MVGSIPDDAVAVVALWCRARVPEAVRDQVRIDCEVGGRDVTILERRPPHGQHTGSEWTSLRVARLRHLGSRGLWRLYWRDRDERWHSYSPLPFAHDVTALLREVDRDPTGIFWG